MIFNISMPVFNYRLSWQKRRNMETLREFQNRNCRGCFYADDKKVGSGMGCCTYPQPIRHERGECLTRREVSNSTREKK